MPGVDSANGGAARSAFGSETATRTPADLDEETVPPMRIAATCALLLTAFAVVSCGSKSRKYNDDFDFAEPNQLVGKEIESRIEQIPFQRPDELFHNLLWLAQQGERSVRALQTGLAHKNPKVRSNCICALGYIGDRRTITFLRPMLEDDSEPVRLEAARWLVRMGDMGPLPKLVEGLDSDKILVRYGCHEALKEATNRDFGYDHLEEDVSVRRVSVLRWREWWAEQSNDPWFAKEYATEHGIERQVAQDDGLLEAGDWPAAPGGETEEPLLFPVEPGGGADGDGVSGSEEPDSPATQPAAGGDGVDDWGPVRELPTVDTPASQPSGR